MALMRIKYIDPADNECGLDQDVPRHLVTVINKRTADGLQEGVLYWPKKGGKGKGKGKKVKEYRVAIVEDNTTPLPSPVRPTGAHGKGQFDKPGEISVHIHCLPKFAICANLYHIQTFVEVS